MFTKLLFSLILCGAALGSCFAQAPASIAGGFYSDDKKGELPGSAQTLQLLFSENGAYESLFSNFGSGLYKYERTGSDTATLTLNGNLFHLTFVSATSGRVQTNGFAPGYSGTFSLNFPGSIEQIVAISNRATATANKAAITGFIVGGSRVRTVLLRGAGPALPSDLVPDRSLDPRIEVYDAAGRQIANNDNWTVDVAIPENVFTPADSFLALFKTLSLMPFVKGSKDAALLVTLQPGAYTIQTYTAAGKEGEAVTEAYLLP